MAKCHLCGEEIPQTEVLKHSNTKHPERRQKSKVAKENEQPKVATTTTTENVSKASIAEQKTETPPVPETKPGPELTIIRTAGIFTYEITLPADAFTFYNLAKALELEGDEKSFDEWVWDCIRARFAKDYKKQVIVAPVEV